MECPLCDFVVEFGEGRELALHMSEDHERDEMAKSPVDDTTAAPEDEWERIALGLGEEWDFHNGPLIGNYLGTTTVTAENKNPRPGEGSTREVPVHQFAPVDDPSGIVFLWGSSELDNAFNSDLVRIGDKVRINYLGKSEFNGQNGPQNIKRYRVDLAKRQ